MHLSEGKGEKRRLRGIIPSSRRRYNCGKCSYCSQSPSADGHHSRMDRFGLGLAAEMGGGGLTQGVYDFGITCKDGSLPTFLRIEEIFYTYNRLPRQLEGKVHFFPSPQGSW